MDDLEKLRAELRDLGAVGEPGFGEPQEMRKLPAQALPNEDRKLIVRLCENVRQRLDRVRAQVSDIEQLVGSLEQLAGLSIEEEQEPTNGVSLHQEP